MRVRADGGRRKRLSWLFARASRSTESDRLFEPPVWRWSQAADVGWWVRAEWQEALLGPKGLRLDEWRREGRLQVIKTGPVRIVYRVELEQGAVFIKHYLVP